MKTREYFIAKMQGLTVMFIVCVAGTVTCMMYHMGLLSNPEKMQEHLLDLMVTFYTAIFGAGVAAYALLSWLREFLFYLHDIPKDREASSENEGCCNGKGECKCGGGDAGKCSHSKGG